MANGVWSNAFLRSGGSLRRFGATSGLPNDDAQCAGKSLPYPRRSLDLSRDDSGAQGLATVPGAIGRPELLDDPRFATAESRHANSGRARASLRRGLCRQGSRRVASRARPHQITFGNVARVTEICRRSANGGERRIHSRAEPARRKLRTIDSPVWLEGVAKELNAARARARRAYRRSTRGPRLRERRDRRASRA